MQFYVPQHIEIEDKIFGPLTFKQFVYLVGGGGLSFIWWVLLPKFFAVLLIVPTVAFSLALAFYKVNNKPFIYIVEAALKYVTRSKLYIWKKRPRKAPEKPEEAKGEATNTGLFAPKLSESKLKDISWSLGVKESIYKDTIGPSANPQPSNSKSSGNNTSKQ